MSLFKPAKAYTLDVACADALADAYQTLKAPRAYRAHIPHLLEHFGPDRPMTSITSQDIEAYQISAQRTWSRNTVRHHVAFLSRAFRLAERLGKVDKNPCRLVHLPRRGDSRRVWLTVEQFHRLILELDSEDRFSAVFFLYTGLRRAEGFRVLVADVDLDHGEVRIVAGKNDKPRWVPIKPEFALVIAEVLARRKGPWLLYAHANSNGSAKLARESAGAAFYRRFKAALKRVGLGEVVLHDLRRTCATWLLKEGVDISTIRDWLGHSSVAVTEVYARVENGSLHRAANKMAWIGNDWNFSQQGSARPIVKAGI